MGSKDLYKKEIKNILTESVTRQIHFSLGGLSINSSGYKRVGDCIMDERIEIVGVGTDDIPSWADAYYNHKKNVLGIKPVTLSVLKTDTAFRALILHECTHAYIDMVKAAATTKVSDEAAAFLAQLIYRLRKDRYPSNLEKWAAGTNTQDAKIFHEAIKVIKKYGLHRGANRTLQRQHYSALRDAIKARYGLTEKEKCGANGIPAKKSSSWW